MKLQMLLGVVLIVTGAWGYSEQCAQGPEYWCRDASTAEDCGAVRHCQQTVWLEKSAPAKLTTTGEEAEMLCDVLVQASSELLKNGLTDVILIKQALRRNCTQVNGHKNLFRRCVTAIDFYLVDILRHIKSGTKSKQICPILRGIGSKATYQHMEKHENVSLKSVQCTFCKFLIGYVDTAIQNNRTPAAIEAELEKVCNVIPASLKDNCTSLVKKYGPIIAVLLATNATPVQICNFIKICHNGTQQINTARVNHLFSMKAVSVHSAQCYLCRYVANYMDSVIQYDQSEFPIDSALGSVCEVLPEPLKHMCNQFVQTYRPVIMQHAGKYKIQARVCDAFKLC